jgi:hypothetical protein
MPTQPTNTGPTFMQRARNRWWNPERSPMRNLGQIALNVIRSGGNPVAAAMQTVAGAGMGEAREGIGNFVRNQGWDFNPFNNRQSRSEQGAPLPGWMQPGAAISEQDPYQLPTYPNYQDPNAVGPPQTLAGSAPMRGAPVPRLASPTSGAGRMGGTTIATGLAAQNMARSFAPTGLGASSWGRDQMMRQVREA